MKNISTLKRKYEPPKIVCPTGKIVSQWMSPERSDRLKEIIRKETVNPEKVEIARKVLTKRTKIFEYGNTRIFVRNVSQEELDVIRRASDADIKTEVPFSFELVTLDRDNTSGVAPMGFLDLGKNINIQFEQLNSSEKQELLLKIMRIISRMQCIGIEHGNLTLKNLFLDGSGEIVVGDFSVAKQRNVNFDSAEDIYNSFKRDYTSLLKRAKIRVHNREFWERFFERLTSTYPISEKTREELDKKIKNELDYCWEMDEVRLDTIC